MGKRSRMDEILERLDLSGKHSVSEQLKSKIDITQVSIRKRTSPLHIAASKNDTGLVKFVLKHAKKHLTENDLSEFINAQDSEGNTALHVAAINGSIYHVKALLHAGAIYKIKNKKGKTPQDLASNQTTKGFLECTRNFFKSAKRGEIKIELLRELDNDELSTIMNARDIKGRTIRQIGVSSLEATVSFVNGVHQTYVTALKILPLARMIA